MLWYLNIINKSPLFEGISDGELESLLGCLGAKTKTYARGQFILRPGDRTSSLGMMLSGSVHVVKEDFWGNRGILFKATPAQIFAETYACVQSEPLTVGVEAAEACEILFLDVGSVLNTCPNTCGFHARLIRNLINALAEKNLMLTRKIEHMAQRSTRDKLLSYLSAHAQQSGCPAFDIPLNRQQLADYLCVDRSAMSSELCRLRDEGVLTFSKNHFELAQ